MQLAKGLGVDPAELLKEAAYTTEHPKPTEAGDTGPFTAVYQRDGEWCIGFVEALPGANAQGEPGGGPRELEGGRKARPGSQQGADPKGVRGRRRSA